MSTTSGMDKLWFIHQEDVITVETNEYCFIQQHGCVSQTKLNERSQDTSNLICFMLTFKNEQNKSMMLQNACVLSCVRLFPTPSTVSTVACQASLSTEFSRQEYWSGLPSPTPGDLPHPGMESHLLHLLRWRRWRWILHRSATWEVPYILWVWSNLQWHASSVMFSIIQSSFTVLKTLYLFIPCIPLTPQNHNGMLLSRSFKKNPWKSSLAQEV